MIPPVPVLDPVRSLGRTCDTYLTAAGHPPPAGSPWPEPTPAEVEQARAMQDEHRERISCPACRRDVRWCDCALGRVVRL